MPNKVVDLGPVRDMMADLDALKALIKKGNITGYNLMMCNDEGEEMVFLGGVYKTDVMAALRAQLRMSGERMLLDAQDAKQKALRSGSK